MVLAMLVYQATRNFDSLFGSRRGRPASRFERTVLHRLLLIQAAIGARMAKVWLSGSDCSPAERAGEDLEVWLAGSRVSALKSRGPGYKLLIQGDISRFIVHAKAGGRNWRVLGEYHRTTELYENEYEDEYAYIWMPSSLD
jgi:hypothetical protein